MLILILQVLKSQKKNNPNQSLEDLADFLKIPPTIGFIRYGKVCFSHITILTNCGTTISSLGDDDALTIAFATVFALREVAEYRGILLKDL